MIILGAMPSVVFGSTCPVIPARITGRSGHTLYVASYDILQKKLISDYTENIDSDDYSTGITIPTPEIDSDTIIDAFIAVKNANGDVVEAIHRTLYFSPNPAYQEIESDATAWYITKLGFAYKMKFPKSSYEKAMIPSSNLTYTILHEDGKLSIYEGSALKLQIKADSIILKLKYKIDKSIASYYANYLDRTDIQNIVFKAPELAPVVGAFRVIERIYEDKRFTPLAVSISADENYIYYDVLTQIDLHTPVDIWNVLKIIAGVGAIAGGAILLVLTAGASAPASYVLIATGVSCIGAGAYTLMSAFRDQPTNIIQTAQNDVNNAKTQINATFEDLKQYLQQLVSEGKITQEEADKILEYVSKIKDIAFKTFDELLEAIKKAYDEGYNKCKEEMWKWIAGSGVGGFIAGLIIGKR